MALGDIGDTHLKAIGQVTVQFAFLEFTVAELIWGLLGIEQKVGQAVTAGLPFRQSVALASTLAKQRVVDPVALSRLDGLLSKALAAENERNTIVHSTWFVLDEGAQVSRLKFRADKAKGRIVHFATVASEQISAIAGRIADVLLDSRTSLQNGDM
jgi:hypothetical protein